MGFLGEKIPRLQMRRVPEVSELTLRRELCFPQPGPCVSEHYL